MTILDICAVMQKELIADERFATLLSLTSQHRQEKVKRFLRPQDAQRSLVSELLIRYMLVRKYALSWSDISFDTLSHGKPFIPNIESIEFSISHSGDWVVCALGQKQVGIDIEKIRQTDLDIARRFFSKEEYRYLSNMDASCQSDAFFELWTLKESYIKALGTGLSLELKSFTVAREPDGRFYLKESTDPEVFTFKQYMIAQGYKCAVCQKGQIDNDQLKSITFNELIDWIYKHILQDSSEKSE